MEKNKKQFLFLDDNDKTTRDGDVEYINSISTCIAIETDYPSSWKMRSEQIINNINKYDGLILDWEFTNQSQEAKEGCEHAEDVDFSSEAIAEHLRVLAAQSKIKDIPIIICSADKNKAFSFIRKKELTSQDLFDLAFVKDEIFTNNTEIIEKQLCDLASVYQWLQEKMQTTSELLAISTADQHKLDIRFIDILETFLNEKTVHDLVQFLLREVIEVEGILIDEKTLASRLGVDISNNSWADLLTHIKAYEVDYRGQLSNGWQRFWAFKLENWWKSLEPNFSLRTSKASKRVEFLNIKFGLDLKVASKIKYCSSEEFWTTCYGTQKPLDPLNGFQISDNIRYPWQNQRYVSAYAELEKEDKSGWKINILDRQKYTDFKNKIKAAQTQ